MIGEENGQFLREVGEGERIRGLKVCGWEVAAARERLVESRKSLMDSGCLDMKISSIEHVMEQKMFCHCGFDKEQRPNIYVMLGRF